MDLGIALWTGITTAGVIGYARHAWQTRRRIPLIVAPPSHVRTVVPKPCAASRVIAPAPDAAHTPRPPSLALDAYSTIAGGTEIEGRVAAAKRRIAHDPLFGDGGVRRTKRDAPVDWDGELRALVEARREASRRIHPSNQDGAS